MARDSHSASPRRSDRFAPALFPLAVLGLLTTACPPAPVPDSGTEIDSGQPEVDAGTSAQRCRDRWTSLCNAWSTCGVSAGAFPSNFASVDECIARGMVLCTGYSDGVTGANGITSTLAQQAQQFEACTAAMVARPACERVFTYLFGSNYQVDPDCFAKDGTLPNGTSCLIGDQCQSAYCRYENGCGTCASQGDVNASCTVSTDCKLGLGCNNGACAAYLSPDAGCTVFDLCPPEMTCVTGHCGSRLTTGATCAVNAPNPCRLGFCNKGKCEDFKGGAPVGGPCGVDVVTGSVTACEYGSVCKFITQAYQGLCVARVQPGDRCFFDQSFQGSQCTVLSQCVNGVCSGAGPEPTCGRDGGAAPARRDGGVLPPADAGAAFLAEQANAIAMLCNALYACPRYAPLIETWIGPRSACDGLFSQAGGHNISNPFARLDLARDQACNAALSTLTACEISDVMFAGFPGPAVCAPPAGVTGPGATCEHNLQCQLNTHCTVGVLSPTCGICATFSGDGGLCAFPDDCADGLNCANGRCVPAGDLAAACSAAAPCKRGLNCKLGFCALPDEVDAGCNPRTSTCAPPLWCNSVTNSCELLHLVGQSDAGTLGPDGGILGAPCGLLGGAQLECPNGYACKITDLGTNTGICDVTRLPGETCSWTGGLFNRGPCRFPGMCVDGICTVGDRNYCQ